MARKNKWGFGEFDLHQKMGVEERAYYAAPVMELAARLLNLEVPFSVVPQGHGYMLCGNGWNAASNRTLNQGTNTLEIEFEGIPMGDFDRERFVEGLTAAETVALLLEKGMLKRETVF